MAAALRTLPSLSQAFPECGLSKRVFANLGTPRSVSVVQRRNSYGVMRRLLASVHQEGPDPILFRTIGGRCGPHLRRNPVPISLPIAQAAK